MLERGIKGIFTSLNSCNELEMPARGKAVPGRRGLSADAPDKEHTWARRFQELLDSLAHPANYDRC